MEDEKKKTCDRQGRDMMLSRRAFCMRGAIQLCAIYNYVLISTHDALFGVVSIYLRA